MPIKLQRVLNPDPAGHLAIILQSPEDVKVHCLSEAQVSYASKQLEVEKGWVAVNQHTRWLYFLLVPSDMEGFKLSECYRKHGHTLAKSVRKDHINTLQLWSDTEADTSVLNLAEGLLLSLYQFKQYKTHAEPNSFHTLLVGHASLEDEDISELKNLVKATFLARDLVNEPANRLNAEKLSTKLRAAGSNSGFKVEVLGRDKIKALKMGGLLAVNSGSVDPPTFNVLEYKPDTTLDQKPIVLVGKGVTYDTGGLSLKTSDGMVGMKADMGGAAAVAGIMVAVAKNKLPIHVVGLIPATDNRPGGNAMTPGDVITMSDGSTVEVLNTDAEGRLILADALVYAKKYNPSLVIDLATLTGSSVMALGKEATAMMGTATQPMQELEESGEATYERLVALPIWEEYAEYLNSDIADLKNIGGRTAGAITAAMFLKHFTGYPWIHLDIASTAYLDNVDHYRGKNGTGAGVRLLYHYLKTKAQNDNG